MEYSIGTITKILDPDLYTVEVDIPGRNQELRAFPKRGEVDEPRVGDVVEYTRDSKTTVDSKMWPFKYYLVKSNEFFIAIDDSDNVAEDGYHTKWTTKLVGLEENGKIALGSEQNPTKNDNTKK